MTGPNGEAITVETLTPEGAAELLTLNTANYRPLRRSLVDRYAADMAAGNWRFTADTIKVDRTGVLADGQNRLTAQVKAGVTLTWAIARNVEPEASMVMDSGGARTAANYLHHVGVENSVVVAAIVRLSLREVSRPNRGVSTSEVAGFLAENPSVRLIATRVNGMTQVGKYVTKSVMGYTWWRLHQLDEFRAEEFFARLNNLENLDKGSPLLALHRRLLSIQAARGMGGHPIRDEQTAAIFYTWNAWVRGESREIIRTITKPEGGIYIPEPTLPRTPAEPTAPAVAEADQLPAHRRRHAG